MKPQEVITTLEGPPPSLGMLVALNALGRNIYGGTVSGKVKAARRAKAARAKRARRANR